MQTALGIVMLSTVALCGWAWSLAAARLHRGLPLLAYEPRRPVPWGLSDLAVVLVVLVGLQYLAGYGVALVRNIEPGVELESLTLEDQAWLLGASSAATLAAVGWAVVWLMARWRCRGEDLGWSWAQVGHDLRLGLVAFVMLAPPVYAVQMILVQFVESRHPLIDMLRENPHGVYIALSSVAAVFVAPLCEEFLFRLLFQGWLEKLADKRLAPRQILWGGQPPDEPENGDIDDGQQLHAALGEMSEQPWDREIAGLPVAQPVKPQPAPFWPILASAALFGLMHLSHGPDWLPLFLLAMGLGFLYQRTHRLLPCIVVHLMLNLSTLVVLLIELRFPHSAPGL